MSKTDTRNTKPAVDIGEKVFSTGDQDLDKFIGDMDDVSAVEAKGWITIAKDGWFMARLMGRHMMNNGRPFYQLTIHKAAKGVEYVTGKGDDAVATPVVKGDIVNLSERSAIKELEAYCESDGVFDIYIRPVDKKPLEGGNSWWDMDVKIHAFKKPSAPVRPVVNTDSDLPF